MNVIAGSKSRVLLDLQKVSFLGSAWDSAPSWFPAQTVHRRGGSVVILRSTEMVEERAEGHGGIGDTASSPFATNSLTRWPLYNRGCDCRTAGSCPDPKNKPSAPADSAESVAGVGAGAAVRWIPLAQGTCHPREEPLRDPAVCLEEALSNIIRHGHCRGEPDRTRALHRFRDQQRKRPELHHRRRRAAIRSGPRSIGEEPATPSSRSILQPGEAMVFLCYGSFPRAFVTNGWRAEIV